MDKKIRNLLILVGILAVLCIGYAVTGILTPTEPEDTEAETEEEVTALFRVTEDGLTALSFTYDRGGDGTAEFWDFVRSEDGNTWRWAGDADVSLSSSAFYAYSTTLASATVVKVFRDVTAEGLSEFGLDAPCKTVYFTDAAGGAQSFCIGAYNAYNGTYYVYTGEDKTTVYLVSGDLYEAFEKPVEDLVFHDDLPACKPEAVVSLTLTRGERTVTLTRGTAEGETGIDAKIFWWRSVDGAAPVQVAEDLGASLELLVGDMDYLTCYSVFESDFSTYGLDEDTTRMTLVYVKTVGGVEVENTFTLTLGGTDQYGYYYANPEGTPLTMLLGGSVFHKVMTYDDTRLSEGDETASS